MINNLELAYTAGLLDGEGSIVIAVSKPTEKNKLRTKSHWLQVSITNTNREIIDWLLSTFGGHISDGTKSISRNKQRPTWNWRITSRKARDFLMKILPYLKIKRMHAEIAIEFQEYMINNNFINKSVPPEVVEKRDSFKSALSSINLGKNNPYINTTNPKSSYQ